MDKHKEQCLYLINIYIKKKYILGEDLIILEFLERVNCLKFIKKFN